MTNLEEHRDETFEDRKFILDHKDVQNCTFIDCELVYSGGPQVLQNNDLENTSFTLDGSAARTIKFLHGLYATGAEQAVEDILRAVKGASSPT